MAKRRLAIIGPLLGELNARVYTGIVRQLAFELGEISNTLLELKRGLIEAKLAARDSGAATPAEQFALNQLAIGGVRYFEYFVRTFADKGGVATAGPNALPFDADAAVGSAPLLPVASVVVEDDECRVYLVAYFQGASPSFCARRRRPRARCAASFSSASRAPSRARAPFHCSRGIAYLVSSPIVNIVETYSHATQNK
jgi:hypothetical protein